VQWVDVNFILICRTVAIGFPKIGNCFHWEVQSKHANKNNTDVTTVARKTSSLQLQPQFLRKIAPSSLTK